MRFCHNTIDKQYLQDLSYDNSKLQPVNIVRFRMIKKEFFLAFEKVNENKLQKKLQFALFHFCFYSKYRPITKQMADLITIEFCSLNHTHNW